ncbi:putative disease resistance protein RGA1 [Ziziphus jujuba]|uniref:Disease resistance protein RGA1 n=1 Tax=Ziziphus jujuba TaxID=326968 RepID=A0ABM4A154_ZIZJJ|nr:putative disease resistance protein RGA1 [Ziziphus jujuba]
MDNKRVTQNSDVKVTAKSEHFILKLCKSLDPYGGVTGELSELKKTILTIKDVLLDAEEKKNHDHRVRIWLKRLVDVVYEADDLMDDFSPEALQQQLMNGSNMGKKVRTFFSSSNQLVFRRTMAHKIKDINYRLAAIGGNRTDFHLEVRHVESRVVLGAREQTYIPEEEVIGRESAREAILDLLLDPKVEKDVSVLPIVGLGGIGKTTLAQIVYNHKKVQTNFDLKIWVCVSDSFDVKSLVEKIIKSATNHCEENQEMGQLLRKLQMEINGKRYFLVLDDVWNEDKQKWIELESLLSSGAKGSRIIITTRSLRVGKITTSTMEPYMLRPLDKVNSWSLFKNVAFKLGHEPNNPNTKKAAMEIVDRCAGIPLAIRTIGKMLYFKNPEAEWSSFLEMDFSKMHPSENDILPALKLSYDNLPSNLKHCFAYCSLFLKDHDIVVEDLIKLWMAQGFIESSPSSQSLEEVGYWYFDELLSYSFFQEVKTNNRTKKVECKMHDLMHDLATYVAGTECATWDFDRENIDGRIRHVSFASDLVSSGLHNSGLKTVPNSIGKLKHLSFQEFPRDFNKLVNLRHLENEGCDSLTHMPSGLGKLTNLRTLNNFVLKKRLNGQFSGGLKELMKLTNLRGQLSIRNLRHGDDASTEYEAAKLNEKQNLHHLNLYWSNRSSDDDIDAREVDDYEISLESLQPHPDLEALSLFDYWGVRLPDWLPSLTKLDTFIFQMIK